MLLLLLCRRRRVNACHLHYIVIVDGEKERAVIATRSLEVDQLNVENISRSNGRLGDTQEE